MSSMIRKSPIWQYFEIKSENNKFAICLLCKLPISRGGEEKKQVRKSMVFFAAYLMNTTYKFRIIYLLILNLPPGTSAMTNHLKLKHPARRLRSLSTLVQVPLLQKGNRLCQRRSIENCFGT